jgi:hypothetical protein
VEGVSIVGEGVATERGVQISEATVAEQKFSIERSAGII